MCQTKHSSLNSLKEEIKPPQSDGAAEDTEEAVSLIAQQEKGEQIQAAIVDAQTKMASQRDVHNEQLKAHHAESESEIGDLEQESVKQQSSTQQICPVLHR